MPKPNIAIITTVANFELYNITSKLFPQNIRKYVIDGRNGMHGISSIYYMFEKLKDENIDWLIMADEDVIFNDSEIVFSIIETMKTNNYSVAGVRDGGVIKHRTFNPYMINTFFSILNFREVLSIWDKKELQKNQYIVKNEFSNQDLNLEGQYDVSSLYEPYYCFYLWLKRLNKKNLYLDANMHPDTISNTVLFRNKVFLCHTWYARSYGKNEKHTNRIDVILNKNKAAIDSGLNKQDYILYKAPFFALEQKTNKFLKKIKRKLKIA